MFPVVYTSALKDFARPGRIWTWFAVAIGIGLIARMWAHFQPGQPVATYGQVSEILVYRVMALVTAIFSMQVVSAELEQKTIVYLLTRSVSRATMYGGRTLAAATAAFGATLMCWAATGIGSIGARVIQTPSFWLDFGVLLIGVLAYTALFVFISLILNRAMIYCLLFAFGWEAFVPNMPGDLYYLSIYPYLKAISNHVRPAENEKNLFDVLAGQVTEMTISRSVAFPVLIGLIVSLAAFGIWIFSVREFVPREDSE